MLRFRALLREPSVAARTVLTLAPMLRRLCLALLILCLSVPAAMPTGAMAAEAQSAAMEHHRHHHPADSSQHDHGDHAAKHECIGCAAPLDRQPYFMAAPAPRGPLTRPGLAAILPETRAGPEVPPPRG